jgi:hypothetical protein
MTFLTEIVGRYGSSYSRDFIESVERFAPQASRFLDWGSGETTRLLCEVGLNRADPLVMSMTITTSIFVPFPTVFPSIPFFIQAARSSRPIFRSARRIAVLFFLSISDRFGIRRDFHRRAAAGGMRVDGITDHLRNRNRSPS